MRNRGVFLCSLGKAECIVENRFFCLSRRLQLPLHLSSWKRYIFPSGNISSFHLETFCQPLLIFVMGMHFMSKD